MQEEKIYDENLKSYSLYELYILLTPILDKIYNNYKSTIEESKLRKISLKIIKECVMNFDINNGISFEEYFEKNMRNYFNVYISNKDSKFKLINDFINNNINTVNSYNSALIEIKKLCEFFIEIEYKQKFSVCQKILNNEKINNILKIIVEKNINLIEDDRTNEIIDDEMFVILIDTYCSINEICKYDIDNNDFDLTLLDNNLKIYFQEISKYPFLTKEQEVELFNRYHNGDESAREILINSNLRLVVNIAKKIYKKYYYSNININFSDLIQEGNLELINAVEKFDVGKEYRFSTYAVLLIKQKIYRYKTIRISKYRYLQKMKIEKAKSILQSKLNELLKSNNKNIDDINELKSKISNLDKQIEELNIAMMGTISLNEPISDEQDDNELEYYIPSNEKSIEEVVEQKFLQEEILNFLSESGLNKMQKIVIQEFYGIKTNSKSLTDIGKKYKLTRERVRQIHNQAIEILSNSDKKEKFAIYINGEEEQSLKLSNSKISISEIEEYIDEEILGPLERSILKRIYGIGVQKQSIEEISGYINLSKKRIIEIRDEALNKLNSYIMKNQKKYIKK